MARSKSTNQQNAGFFPEHIKIFMARRVFDTAAIALFMLAAFWVLSLLSYHPDDVSVNSARATADVVDTPKNGGGRAGAYLSDLMIQSFGISSLFIGLLGIIWAVRLLKRYEASLPLSLRICAGLASVAFCAVGLAAFEPVHAPSVLYWGGAVGHSLFNVMVRSFVNPYLHAVLGGILLCLGLSCFALAIGASRAFWAAQIKKGLSLVRLAVLYAVHCVRNLYRWLRHYDALEWESPQDHNASRAPRAKIAPKVMSDDDLLDAPIAPAVRDAEIITPSVVTPAVSAKKDTKQKRLSFNELSDWELPPADMLQAPKPEDLELRLDERALQRNADMLQQVLTDFGVDGQIVKIRPGPVVTLYELEPAAGVKSSKVIGLSDDIARSMSALSVRAAVVPGRSVIGIEIPNQHRQIVYLRSLIESHDYRKAKAALPLILGKDIGGESVVADLAKMPHLLIAGTTGSGKSVAVNTMILSLLYQLSPQQCRMIMIDPKMLELSVYDDIPHLLSPVVTDPGRAVVALKWAVQEMENRYRAMSKFGVRNIDGYNAKVRDAIAKGEDMTRKVQTGYDPTTGAPVFEDEKIELTELPYIVIVVDEFADLMLVAGKDVESAIQRLAQMARAAGIHLIMATQRPSVDVITGVVKANFPTRISFQVTSKFDSRTILGDGGAEQLLGRGDMLYMASGGKIQRVHGPFVDDKEVEDVVQFVKEQGEPDYLGDVTDDESGGIPGLLSGVGGEGGSGSAIDEMYDEAVALIAREGKASTSFIQRHLQIGYNRAARIIEEMEKQGVVGPANHVGKREILVGDHSTNSAAG